MSEELREQIARTLFAWEMQGWKQLVPAPPEWESDQMISDRVKFRRQADQIMAVVAPLLAEKDAEIERLADEVVGARELAASRKSLVRQLEGQLGAALLELDDRPTRHAYEAACEALEKRRVELVGALDVDPAMSFYAAVDAVGALRNQLAEVVSDGD